MNIEINKDTKVLFVCNANVGRSQFALGFYNHLTGSNSALSAGVHPDKDWKEHPTLRGRADSLSEKFPGFVSPIDIMNEVNVDISSHARMLLTKDKVDQYDLIVNIAERSQTPDWLRGENVVWWDIPDPTANGDMHALRKARDEIEWRVKKLVAGEIINDETGDEI